MKYFTWVFCLANIVVVIYLFTIISSTTLLLPHMHCVEKYMIIYSSSIPS
jgi:hypothetical protein